MRFDVEIPSHGEVLAAWVYPGSAKPSPCVVLAHGLGAVREMRLDAYAERFQQEGYSCLVFDYRCSGSSTGKPRGLVDFARQQEDWDAVLDYIKSSPAPIAEVIDPTKLGIFGSSFGGGHVIQVAARHPELKAVISQCPFTSGFASSFTTGLLPMPKLLWLSLRDTLFGTDDAPVRVPLVGKPGEAALMNAPDVEQGYKALIPPNLEFLDSIPARFVLKLPLLRPGSYASSVQSPIFFAICGKDSVAPPGPSLSYAQSAKRGTVKHYEDMGHFDIYTGEQFERVTKDYAAFLAEQMPVPRAKL